MVNSKWSSVCFTFVLGVMLMISSCSSDDDGGGNVNPLIGTWNVTEIQASSANVGTVDAVVSGTITFNADGTGQQNYAWTALGVTVNEGNTFTWVSSSSTITFDPGDVDQTIWTRLENTANRQRGKYQRIEDGQVIDITITITK